MKQSRLALSALMLAASSALAFAQSGPPGQPGAPGRPGAPGQSHTPPAPRFSAEDAAAFSEARTEARIAALKAGLKLNVDQEKLWPAFEAALRNQAKGRADWMAARRAEWTSRTPPQAGEQRPAIDPVKRMRDGATLAQTRAAELTKLADAAEPLVKSLDEAQLRRFNLLMRPDRGRFAGGEGRGWRNEGWRGQHR